MGNIQFWVWSKAFWTSWGKYGLKYPSRVWFGALTVETSSDVLQPRILVLVLFSHAWIFCHGPLNFQSFTSSHWRGPLRALRPKRRHTHVASASVLLWLWAVMVPCIEVKFSRKPASPENTVYVEVAPLENKTKTILKILTTCLQNILMKHFNFKRSAYFLSVIFQKNIWNFKTRLNSKGKNKEKRKKRRTKKTVKKTQTLIFR